MRNYPLDKDYPSLSYIVTNWPKTKPILRKFVMSNHKKPDLLKLCTNCLKDLNVHNYHNLKNALFKISQICSKNVNSNTYHDQHHFKAVIIISCLLAKLSNLKTFDLILLVIIALAHDINHQGRRIIKKPFYQEIKSASDLEKIIFRKILNHKKWQRIFRIIKSTYFPIKPEAVDDYLEKIILDADVIGSLMFGMDSGIEFARRLKHEIRFAEDSEKLFGGFLKFLSEKSLYLDSSRDLC